MVHRRPDAPKTRESTRTSCARSAASSRSETRDQLAAAVEAGKVKVDYRPFDFLDQASTNDYSSRASTPSPSCSTSPGAEVAKEFHDLLFENQPDEGGPFPSNDELVDLAVEAGADEAGGRGRHRATASRHG